MTNTQLRIYKDYKDMNVIIDTIIFCKYGDLSTFVNLRTTQLINTLKVFYEI